jgi:hypothetical protein
MTIAPTGVLRASKVSNLNGNRVKRVAIELNNSSINAGHQTNCPLLPLDTAFGLEEDLHMDIATASNEELMN